MSSGFFWRSVSLPEVVGLRWLTTEVSLSPAEAMFVYFARNEAISANEIDARK